MAVAKCFFFVYIFIVVFEDVNSLAIDNDIDERLNALLERIESLEVSKSDFEKKQTENEQEILSLKLKINEMEANFKLKEDKMLKQLHELKTASVKQKDDETDHEQNTVGSQSSEVDDIAQKIFRKDRESPENGIAFYATHSDHDIHHLGAKQILQFQQVITNIGHAYNNETGAFIAPVDGTYVIHATIMGIDIHVSNHMHAHIAIDSIMYSKFWVTAGDQSSQMLVIDLKAGQTVTVRNDFQDNGFVGQHYSTFSGFLLYEHPPSGVIVGK